MYSSRSFYWGRESRVRVLVRTFLWHLELRCWYYYFVDSKTIPKLLQGLDFAPEPNADGQNGKQPLWPEAKISVATLVFWSQNKFRSSLDPNILGFDIDWTLDSRWNWLEFERLQKLPVVSCIWPPICPILTLGTCERDLILKMGLGRSLVKLRISRWDHPGIRQALNWMTSVLIRNKGEKTQIYEGENSCEDGWIYKPSNAEG